MKDLFETWFQSYSLTVVLTILLTMGVVLAVQFLIRQGKGLPSAYSIAVLGYPRSGKTFLITATFAELFANRVLGVITIPRGKETIEKVNEDLSLIDTGKPVGPTKVQDLFAYRADIIRGVFPFKRRYKTEIGDFPGEDSEEFSEAFGEWFHKTPFFKWAMEANAFVFVIDLAPCLSDRESNKYIAKTTRTIRAAWQHLLEHHFEGKKNIKAKPVSIVFTKADLMLKYNSLKSSVPSEKLSDEISKFGFDLIEPMNHKNKEIELDSSLVKETKDRFSDIIDYLNSQVDRFDVEFVSAIVQTKNGRLGIKNLLHHILPR